MMTQGQYIPEFMKTDALLKKQVGEFKKGLFDPFIKETFGYESPESKMNTLMSNTDFSSKESIQNTFNTLMKQDPMKAAQWLKDSEAAIKLFDTKQASMSDLRTQQLISKENREAKAENYLATLPAVQDYQSGLNTLELLKQKGFVGTKVYNQIKEDIRNFGSKESIQTSKTFNEEVKKVVDDIVDFGYTDFSGDIDLPPQLEGWDSDTLSGWIARYSKAYKIDPVNVTKAVLNGEINPNTFKPPGSTSQPVNQQTNTGVTSSSPASISITAPNLY